MKDDRVFWQVTIWGLMILRAAAAVNSLLAALVAVLLLSVEFRILYGATGEFALAIRAAVAVAAIFALVGLSGYLLCLAVPDRAARFHVVNYLMCQIAATLLLTFAYFGNYGSIGTVALMSAWAIANLSWPYFLFRFHTAIARITGAESLFETATEVMIFCFGAAAILIGISMSAGLDFRRFSVSPLVMSIGAVAAFVAGLFYVALCRATILAIQHHTNAAE